MSKHTETTWQEQEKEQDHSSEQPQAKPLITWQQPVRSQPAPHADNVIPFQPATHRATEQETTVVTWAVGTPVQPAKLIMVSSGFTATRAQARFTSTVSRLSAVA